MGFKLPNGATVEHAATYAEVLVVSAISNAAEAVADVTDADLDVGDIVLIESGWSALNSRVAQVKLATATAITLEDIDTSDLQRFPAGSGGGALKKIETWVQIPQVTEVAFAGGEQQYADVVFLEDLQGRQIPTDKSAASMTLTIADDPGKPFVKVLESADTRKQVEAARMNLPGNDMLLWGVYTSFSKQPAVARNSVLTRTVNLALQGEPSRYLS